MQNKDNYDFLCWKIQQGINTKNLKMTKEYQERLDYELKIISDMGFVDYFLIISDILNTAEEMDIPRGPGRGSAAGSLVAYLTGITTIDPLQFGLFFERFLNPARISMPDVDIDLCSHRRLELVTYIQAKYGEERVGNIISFGKMKPRNAIKKVAKVIGMGNQNVTINSNNYVTISDAVAKSIPMSYDDIDEAVENREALKELSEEYPELFEKAKLVCGKPSHTGIHAAGLIICPEAIPNYVPLYYGSAAKKKKGHASLVQWDMYDLEEAGFLKVDLLGLNTLTIMKRTTDSIFARTGEKINLEDIDLEDKQAIQIFARGNTTGLFQLERRYVQDLCREMQITKFMDVVDMNAIIRPGTMDSGGTAEFIARKTGAKPIEYLHPTLKKSLENTYGIFVYQEQIMSVVKDYAGFTLAESDNIRKAIGKKIMSKMMECKKLFMDNAKAMGRDEKVSEEIFAQIETAGRYSFNLSHAVSYAKITLHAAWLKAHYPTEYMCELLNGELGNGKESKIEKYINEAILMGINVKKSSILTSDALFRVNNDKEIEFGMAFIRNITESTSNYVANLRGKYKTFGEFLALIPSKLTSKCIKSLINAGAMDCFSKDRDELLFIYEKLSPITAKMREQQKRKKAGINIRKEFSLNDILEAEKAIDITELTERRTMEQVIDDEFFETKTYLTYSPILPFEDIVMRYTNTDIADVVDGYTPKALKTLTIVGMLKEVRVHTITKAGKNKNRDMCFLNLENSQRELSCVMFPDSYEKFGENLIEDKIYIVRGKKEKQGSFIVEKIKLLSTVKEESDNAK